VAAVEGMFEKLDYPIDVIWLDIDHTDGMRYFTVSCVTAPYMDLRCIVVHCILMYCTVMCCTVICCTDVMYCGKLRCAAVV
jgi:hypothetical protein